jgi:hypothetical protein
MKRGILLVFSLCLTQVVAAQVDLSLNLNYTRPQGAMGRYIQNAGGISGQALYRIANTPFAIGAELGYNSYGSETTRQTYRFSDGSSTETDVTVSNNYATFAVVGRIDFKQGGPLIPYAIGKAGFNHYWTSLVIADPEDADGCRPLENKRLLEDGALAGTLGAGVRWDLSGVFKKAEPRHFWLDFGVNYTTGGNVRFMNVNMPADPDPVAHQHPVVNADGSVPFSARFINPQNQIVHEHHVGNVYNSPIQKINVQLGFLISIR